jgi:tRNA(Met) cytidine acetyltransferase
VSAPGPRHRRLIVLRGSAEVTREAALQTIAGLDPEAVAWLGEAPGRGSAVAGLTPSEVAKLLGRSFDALVFDAHLGLDADLLGQSHGLVRGGGGFILRLPERGAAPAEQGQAKLAAFPHDPAQVGARFLARFEEALGRAQTCAPVPLEPPPRELRGHAEQARVVARLVALWSAGEASRSVLLADRGRGKSSALGLALAALAERSTAAEAGLRVAVSAARPEAVAEVFRFATGDPTAPSQGPVRFVPLSELVFGEARFELIVVDEAAQLPVPMLRALALRHADAQLCFSTTTHGYEGTGRGFVLRFLAGLERGPVPVERLSLTAPIRWDPGDGVERFVFDALLLDAEPAQLETQLETPLDPALAADFEPSELVAERVDRDALVRDERSLRELFGLLVHAHYRTTPSDLHRLLDAPNLAVHVLRLRGRVVAATIVAEEGGLPESLCEELCSGRRRIRAHALPEILVAHLGKVAAGRLRMLRSVRIATHPALRRRGLATRLVEHVHREHAPDLFGTVFGATAELIAFRRSLGYELVRISASRGARTGEPSVMMMRPVSPAARALLTELRAELARDLPRQLELLRADNEMWSSGIRAAQSPSPPARILSSGIRAAQSPSPPARILSSGILLAPDLEAALVCDLPAPAPASAQICRELVESYAHGPRTFESVALALARFVEREPQRLARLDPCERKLVEGRVLAARSWQQVARDAGLSGVPAAMRALRRAVRRMLG